jgi:hypothetical protein
MLTITVLGDELFDEETDTFSTPVLATLDLEHSLASLSKWESFYKKPFLANEDKSEEEILGYIKLMIQTPNFPPEVLQKLSQDNLNLINDYMNDKMTATWFSEQPNITRSREVITSELLYYWMVTFNIPFECENWHLNRLLTLIRLCSVKNSKPKQMSSSELAARNRELNAQRRRDLGTSG